jgi:hypothetical protein
MKGKKLRATLAYPALFESEPEGGFTVTFPEAGIAATYGASWTGRAHRPRTCSRKRYSG